MENYKLIDFSNAEKIEKYKLMSDNIIPRPIAWIVTENNGNINLAPFSYFIGVCGEPSIVMVSVAKKKRHDINEPKDTLVNIKQTKKATICLVPLELTEKMDKTGEVLPYGVNEAERFGIELEKIDADFPPIVKGCKRAFLTTLYGTFEKEEMVNIAFFLEIKKMYLEGEFEPVARVGKGYAKLCDIEGE